MPPDCPRLKAGGSTDANRFRPKRWGWDLSGVTASDRERKKESAEPVAGMARGQSIRQMGSTRHFFASSKTKAKQNLGACRQGRMWQRVGMDAHSGQREAAHGRWVMGKPYSRRQC